MARINIEQAWWSDSRRAMLGRLVGSQSQADGIMMSAWRTAQTYWSKGELVPTAIWETIEHHDLIVRTQLAFVRENGVYVAGSEQ